MDRGQTRKAAGFGSACLAAFLFLLDRAVSDLPGWLLYPAMTLTLLGAVTTVTLPYLDRWFSFHPPIKRRLKAAGSPETRLPAGSSTASPVAPAPSRAQGDPFVRAAAMQHTWQQRQQREAVVAVAEELEQNADVLTAGEVSRYFVTNDLATAQWEEHGKLLINAAPVGLHRSVRKAYRAIHLFNQGIRRGVTSSGRPDTLLRGDLLSGAREAIADALTYLEKAEGGGSE